MAGSAWKLYNANRAVQIGASSLSVILGICIVGTAAHTISVYNSQKESNPFWLPLWPEHFNTNGTRSLLGANATVVVLHSMYLLFSLLPKFNMKGHPGLSALNTGLVTFLTAMVTVMAVIFAHVLNHRSSIDTIQTWSCELRKSQNTMMNNLSMPSAVTNAGFNGLCHESRFAIWGTFVIILLNMLMFACAAVGFIKEKLANRMREKGAMSPDGSVELVHTQFGNDKSPAVVATAPGVRAY